MSYINPHFTYLLTYLPSELHSSNLQRDPGVATFHVNTKDYRWSCHGMGCQEQGKQLRTDLWKMLTKHSIHLKQQLLCQQLLPHTLFIFWRLGIMYRPFSLLTLVYFLVNNYLYAVDMQPNIGCSYSLFGRIFYVIIWYSPNNTKWAIYVVKKHRQLYSKCVGPTLITN